MKKSPLVACLAGTLLLLNACDGGSNKNASGVDTVMTEGSDTVTVVGQSADDVSNSPTGMRGGDRAVATINGKSGSSVTGTATFTQTGDNKVRMILDIQQAPQGVHAIHLHQNGDCSAADATSAGPHWNPTKQPHGNRESKEAHHMGDLPNLTIGADGRGRTEMVVEGWTIGGSDTTTSIVNRAIIIHARADDYKSQPAGNAGDRIGCGVIVLQAAAN